jgi:hypothetical protein
MPPDSMLSTIALFVNNDERRESLFCLCKGG